MTEQLPVNQVLKKAAEKVGFNRVRYSEKNVPTTISNVTVFVYFGDLRSTMLLSSLLLKRFKEEARGSKYFIMLSWPGNKDLFPWVDEYWELRDDSHCRNLYNSSKGLHNNSDLVVSFQRILNTYFEEVIDPSVLEPYYQDGFQKEFFNRFLNIKRYLPNIPSAAILGNEFNKKMAVSINKCVIYPSMYIQHWKDGRLRHEHVIKDFWVALVERFLKEGITPVIMNNYYTHDLSMDFAEKCLYFIDSDVSKTLSVMRSSGCVLDLFTGISRYAIMARSPFVACHERTAYNMLKEYAIDDLVAFDLPKDYIWTFPSISNEMNKYHWNPSLFDIIILKVMTLLNDIDRDQLPSPTELFEVVPYSRVREIKSKKLATQFIKIQKY